MMRCYTRWYSLVGLFVGVVVMAAGLAFLVFRHDAAGGYSFLGVGAVIFGTSGVPAQRGRKPGAAR